MANGDRLGDWIELVDTRFPERDAAAWDATGLQVGHPEDRVTRVLVSLDVTEAVLAEAERVGADLLLAHHPLLFRPLERLTPATAAGRLALRAARAGIGVLAAHTNFDVAQPGTTDPVVEALDLADVRPLAGQASEGEQVKLVTFVPSEHTGTVIAAVCAAGAGRIGEYEECTFRVGGTGTFRPSSAANPTVGERERSNEVPEDRLEVVVPRQRLPAVVEMLEEAHPYEEVAYDVYPLVPTPASSKGSGRVGRLPDPLPLREVADRLARALPSPHLRVAGELERSVEVVAACGGAGDAFLGAALASSADVYVTGDLRHHVALDALTQGLALIDAGHYATEAAALPAFIDALAPLADERGLVAALLASRVRTEPWADYRAPSAETRTNETS